MRPEYRRATSDDLEAILEIERASFSIPWSPQAIGPELQDDTRHLPLVALLDDCIVAFALLWVIGDEVHLVNFAVRPEQRRAGVGRALLVEVLARARARSVRRVTLEVREGNEVARLLYREFGFAEVALRPRYYPDTREDAVIMLLELADDGGAAN